MVIKARLKSFLDSYVTPQITAIQTAALTLMGQYNHDSLEGKPLIELAKIVGAIPCPVETVAARAVIKAKSIANQSRGKYEDVYAAAKAITYATQVVLEELYPAEVRVKIYADPPAECVPWIMPILRQVVGKGITLHDVQVIRPIGSGWFIYDSTSPTTDGYNAGKYTDFVASL